jgi:hypothetical protein
MYGITFQIEGEPTCLFVNYRDFDPYTLPKQTAEQIELDRTLRRFSLLAQKEVCAVDGDARLVCVMYENRVPEGPYVKLHLLPRYCGTRAAIVKALTDLIWRPRDYIYVDKEW